MSSNDHISHAEEEGAGEQQPLLGSRQPANPSLYARLTALKHPSQLNSLERLLIGLTLLFLVLSAVMSGLFAGLLHKDRSGGGGPTGPGRGGDHHGGGGEGKGTVTRTVPGPTPTSAPPRAPHDNDAVCLSSRCVSVAARIINGMDTTVSPCHDFYTFANGGWLRENPVPEDKPLYGVGEQVTERNKRIIQTILTEPPSLTLPSIDLHLLDILRTFYSSCMSESIIDAKGSAPLMEMIDELLSAWRGQDDLVLQSDADAQRKWRWDPETRRDRLTAALLFLHSRAVPSLFDFYLEGDVKSAPSTMVLWLQQSGLSLPAKQYYKDARVVQTLKDTIKNVLDAVYVDERRERVDSGSLARGVVGFESKLARASLDMVDSADPELTYNKFDNAGLQSLFPSISFPNYFSGFAPRPRYPAETVIVTSPSYIAEVSKLVDGEEDAVLEAYFVFKIAQSYGKLLGAHEDVKLELASLDAALSGVPSDVKPRRSDICLSSLLNNYGFLAGRYFVLQAFDAESKHYAQEVFDAIVGAFRERLPQLDWLDEKTRVAADNKAEAIACHVGYPDSTPINTTDPASLQRYYALSAPPIESDYFGNVARSRVADQKRLWAGVGKERDGKWEMIPSEVNAYYNPSSNEVVFPSGILQEPYFSKSWPEYLVFGSLGSVAGHELSHAFDSSGRQYNAEGKLTDWWTKSTIKRFEKLKQCFLKQYSNYSIIANGKAYHINAELTIGEDMADAGGLAQSFKAWKDRLAEPKKHANYLLPGLPYSREQLFFIAYAQGWARGLKPEEAIRRIRVDPHSPTSFRVIGPLSNDLNFQKAFNCVVGSTMSRVDKCQIW